MDNFKERNKDFGLEAYALSLPVSSRKVVYLSAHLYVLLPKLKHLTHGSDKFGHTMLSPHLFAEDRSRFDAMNVLPNLSGSGMLLARAYKDKLMVVASLNTQYFILTLGIIFFVGLLCAMCVPRLPLEVRRRGLGLSSWILAFQTREVEVEGYNDISHGMELDALQKLSSEIILRHRKQALP
ncbi:hypothetical protein BJ165DRAFT_1358384 [Panaeolus papilionaceus]|nr:hypothetical protein BJ165DRAFT_1358384 [Panaeolus papilionaceus]